MRPGEGPSRLGRPGITLPLLANFGVAAFANPDVFLPISLARNAADAFIKERGKVSMQRCGWRIVTSHTRALTRLCPDSCPLRLVLIPEHRQGLEMQHEAQALIHRAALACWSDYSDTSAQLTSIFKDCSC